MNKKFILWLSLLIAFSLIPYSCRSDLQETSHSEHQHSQVDKFVSFQKFLQVTGINENQFHQNLTAKTFSSDDFDIDTEKIRQTLRNNEIKAFSFLITPKDNALVSDNIFYNLAYIRQSDNTWNKYVVKYVSNNLNFLADLQNNPELKFQGSNEVVYSENNVSKVSSTGLCAFTSEVEVWNCPAGHTRLADCYESGGTSSCCIGCIHFDSVTIVKECSTANQGGGSPGDADGDGFPDNPDTGSGGGEGDGNIFEPSLPLYDPKANTPCKKTKAMLQDPEVKQAVADITTQAKKAANDINEGEMGRIEKNDGTIVPADVSADHHVTFNNITGSKGAYHNHTMTGAKIHSPPDIESILAFASVQPSESNYGDAYLGMIGAEKCYPASANCYRIYHYIIHFNGTASDLTKSYTEDDMKKLINKAIKRESKLAETLPYVDFFGDVLNKKGVEKLFFDTLTNMELSGKVTLQRVDDNGTVYNISLDENGVPKATPCP